MGQHINYYPLIVDGTVYVSIVRDERDGGLAAIDAETGEAETVIESDAYFWKPTIVDGTVYAALDNSIGAFDLEDGTKRWQTDDLFAWPSPPLCVDGTVVTGRGSEVFGFDAATGEQAWNVGDSSSENFAGRPIIADGMVVQSNLRPVVDLKTGRSRAELPHPITYPSLYRGRLVGLSVPQENPFHRFGIGWNTLQTKWNKPDDRKSMGGFGSSVDGRYLSVETEEVKKFSVAARSHSTGELLWRTRELDAYPKFIATDQDTAYVVCSKFPVFGIDLETGEINWEFTPSIDTTYRGGGIALADDLLVVTDGIGNVWALE